MRKSGKGLRRTVTVAMCGILMVETINCVGLTAKAQEYVSAGDAIVMDQELKEQVSDAEDAAALAEQAAADAKKAKELAEELANAASGALDTTIGDDGEVPVLKEEIETAISDAEGKTEEVSDLVDEKSKELDGIADEVKSETENNLGEAQKAAEEAQKQLQAAQEALHKIENLDENASDEEFAEALEEINSVAQAAQAQADVAKQAYDSADDAYQNALTKYNNALAAAETAVAGDSQAAEQAIAEAQALLDNAKSVMDSAWAEYDKATADSKAAADCAAKAAEQCKIVSGIAGDVTGKLEEAKDVDVEKLSAEKEAKEQELRALNAEKEKIDAEENAYIEEQSAKIKAAEIARDAAQNDSAYTSAKDTVRTLEHWELGMLYTELGKAKIIVNNGTGFCWKLFKDISKQELEEAQRILANYEAAKKTISDTEKEIAEQNKNIEICNRLIEEANAKKTAVALSVSGKENEVTEIQKTLALVLDYVYAKDAQISYLDKADEETYQKLLGELDASYGSYVEIKTDTENYIEATKKEGFVNWLTGIFTGDTWEKWFKELDVEAKYHVWNNREVNGTYIILQNDKNNTQALIVIRDAQATITEIDELEFATYATTFDAVAAAQASQRAAEAKLAEETALKKYNAAVEELASAQKRLDALKLSKLEQSQARADLETARLNAENAMLEWERAQKDAQEAMNNLETAQGILYERENEGQITNPDVELSGEEEVPENNAQTPVRPTTTNESTVLAAVQEEPEEADAQPLLAVTPVAIPAAADEQEQDIVSIEDEETPLAESVEEEDDTEEVVTTIEDEETPLAEAPGHCTTHWIILAWTLCYAVYTLVRFSGRRRKNSKLKYIDMSVTIATVVAIVVLRFFWGCGIDMVVSMVAGGLVVAFEILGFVQNRRLVELDTDER